MTGTISRVRFARSVAVAVAAVVGATLTAAAATPAASARPAMVADNPFNVQNVWTPVTVSTFSPMTSAVSGSDRKYHVVYELELTNAKQDTATVNSITVADGSDPTKAIMTYTGADLLAHLHTLAPSNETPLTNTQIPFDESRLLFVELAFDSRADVPAR